jgi:hypothetical protein
VLSEAASSNVSGGTSRVLVRPGAEALAMKAMPQLAGSGRVDPPVFTDAETPFDRLAWSIQCPLMTASICKTIARPFPKRQSLPPHTVQVGKHSKVIRLTNS